jgi:hypothetical protein
MSTNRQHLPALPAGEQPEAEQVFAKPVVADTFAGRVHVEWDDTAAVTPLGQLPFFIEYLKQGGLFDGWVADCPLHYTSPNAPSKRDVLGTVLAVLAGHRPTRNAADAAPTFCARNGRPLTNIFPVACLPRHFSLQALRDITSPCPDLASSHPIRIPRTCPNPFERSA